MDSDSELLEGVDAEAEDFSAPPLTDAELLAIEEEGEEREQREEEWEQESGQEREDDREQEREAAGEEREQEGKGAALKPTPEAFHGEAASSSLSEAEGHGASPSSLPLADDRFPRKSGQRRVIEHTLSNAATIDPLDPEEVARREARAKKFGCSTAPALSLSATGPPPVLLSRDEVLARQARAAKFGVEKPFNPLDAIATAAGGVGKGLWEKRRDAAPDEPVRAEAVYIYGTDRLSTDELLRLFVRAGVDGASPKHAEWIDDSSAVVVFHSAEDATAALLSRTELLVALTEGGLDSSDHLTWRTTPAERAAAGKGLQLLFRRATVKDVKPARRNASRWYGEASGRGGHRAVGSGRATSRGIVKPGRPTPGLSSGATRTLAAALARASGSQPVLGASPTSGDLALRAAQPDLRERIRAGRKAAQAPREEAGAVGRGPVVEHDDDDMVDD